MERTQVRAQQQLPLLRRRSLSRWSRGSLLPRSWVWWRTCYRREDCRPFAIRVEHCRWLRWLPPSSMRLPWTATVYGCTSVRHAIMFVIRASCRPWISFPAVELLSVSCGIRGHTMVVVVEPEERQFSTGSSRPDEPWWCCYTVQCDYQCLAQNRLGCTEPLTSAGWWSLLTITR